MGFLLRAIHHLYLFNLLFLVIFCGQVFAGENPAVGSARVRPRDGTSVTVCHVQSQWTAGFSLGRDLAAYLVTRHCSSGLYTLSSRLTCLL